MAMQQERNNTAHGSAWSNMICERVVAEDVSFLIVDECQVSDRTTNSFLNGAMILTGVTGFMVVLNMLL